MWIACSLGCMLIYFYFNFIYLFYWLSKYMEFSCKTNTKLLKRHRSPCYLWVFYSVLKYLWKYYFGPPVKYTQNVTDTSWNSMKAKLNTWTSIIVCFFFLFLLQIIPIRLTSFNKDIRIFRKCELNNENSSYPVISWWFLEIFQYYYLMLNNNFSRKHLSQIIVLKLQL